MPSIFSFCYGKVDTLPTTSLTCQVIVEGTNLTLTGQLENVMATRATILNLYPTKLHLKIPDQDYNNRLRAECEKIAQMTNTRISIIPQSIAVASENIIHIHITGTADETELARVQILVLLDKLAQLTVDTIAIPSKLHHLICGRRRIALQSILESTKTNIYFPSPFNNNNTPLIYITGESNGVVRVKEMLTKLAAQKAQSMYHKDAVLHPRKLDWMLLHCRDDLRKIMKDNGSYISFPKIASGNDFVTVYAENRVNAERTCRSLYLLACGIFEACFYFNQDHASYGVENIISQLAQASAAEVSFIDNCIQVFAPENAIRQVLYELSFLKVFPTNTVLNIELSLDQQEFISGKKSGKIIKIMKTSGVKIKFVPFSEYNFIIEMETYQFNKASEGLALLQEELPAEISFYVPEKYHKRIIGVGGKNIQRIMKKYGVYVKFSNAEEFASLGGYFDNEDNVVARTPMKNRDNLENLRQAVMELISPKDRDSVEHIVHDVPFWHRRAFMRDLKDVARITNTQLIWPDDELANDSVTVVGPESQITVAAEMIKAIIPEEYHIRLPYSAQLNSILEQDTYRRLVQSISNDYRVSVEVKRNMDQEDQVITFKTTKANTENLRTSLDVLIKFLKTQQVNFYDDGTMGTRPAKNNPQFSGFENAVLGSSPVPPSPSSSSSLFPMLKSYSLFGSPNSSYSRGGLGSSRSTSQIRAIFDTPSPVPLVSPLNFRSPPSTQNDIWSNPPQPFGAPGLENKQYDYGFYQPKSDVAPASSTSTGSNNSSMHSTQSMDSKLANHTPSNRLDKSLEFPSLFADETVIQNLLNNMSLNN